MATKIPQIRVTGVSLREGSVLVEMEYSPDVSKGAPSWYEAIYWHHPNEPGRKDHLELEDPSKLAKEEHGDAMSEFAQLHLVSLGFEPAYGSSENTLAGKPLSLEPYDEK